MNGNSVTGVFNECGLTVLRGGSFAEGTYISQNFSGLVLVVAPKRLKLRGLEAKASFFNFTFRAYSKEHRIPTRTLLEFGNLPFDSNTDLLKHWVQELLKVVQFRRRCSICRSHPYLTPVILENKKLGTLRCPHQRH